MRIAGGAENFFKTLEKETGKPFREMGSMGIKLPGLAPLALGVGAAALVKKDKASEKKLREIVRQETQKAVKAAKQGPGLNFDLF